MKPNTVLDLKNEMTESKNRTKQSSSPLKKLSNSIPQGSVGKAVINNADGKKE